MANISAAFQIALQHHQAGRLDLAAEIYRRILAVDPHHAESLHMLGSVAQQQGQPAAAADYLGRAITVSPTNPRYHCSLGEVYRGLQQMPQAIACYQRALQLRPDYPEAYKNLGIALRVQGKLDEAVACCGRAVQLRPDYAEAHNNLGIALRGQGKLDEAVACCGRALQLRPDYAEAHNNLGNALRDQGKLDEAIVCYQRALQLKPDLAETQHNLGNALQDQGKLDEAVACYQRALQLRPDFAEPHYNLGNVWTAQRKVDEAVACYQRAVHLRPDYAEAHNNLGNALQDQGKLDEAVACYQRVLHLRPDYAEAHNNLGFVLQDQGKLDEAVACYQRALELRPDFAAGYCNLGSALLGQGKLNDAMACYQQALQVRPDFEANCNVGIALMAQGRLEEATACYQQSMALKPDYARAHSYYLYAQRYDPHVTPAALAEAHTEYDRRHAAGFRSAWRAHHNSPEPGRRLRLGFVSPMFSGSPVGSFLIAAVEHLDRTQCEVLCYSDRIAPDDVTARFQAAADVWCDAFALSDGQLAERIRADQVDILFDLAGHTPQNRLLTLARRPAPIQITWIDSVGTTGLSAIDYVLADRWLIPPGAEAYYTERVLRMPDDYVCYDPPAAAEAVGPLPAARQGYVTFGSFSRPAKIRPQVVRVWADILRCAPGSRLVLKHQGFEDPGTMDRFRQLFAAEGVDPARLELQGYSSLGSYFDEYRRIDVTLDPFPHCGGLTTCDSLWMGVPVVTCPGETFAGRQSLSHLSTVGLTETIANTREQYVELAVELANDLPHLAQLRARLRPQMAASPLCDGKRFAKNLMHLLRDVWRDWCHASKST